MNAASKARIIVIGAGMGGLAAAIRLAGAGQSVTLIEAADGPGGKARCLPSAAGPVDTGPTVLTLREVFDDLFASAGARLDDHVTLIRQRILARHWWPDGSSVDLFDTAEDSAAAIRAFAGPGAEADFRRFDRISRALFDGFEAPMLRASRPRVVPLALAAARVIAARPGAMRALLPGARLSGLLRGQFRDPRLRQLFGRYATYVGGCPGLSPAVLALVWQAEARGVWAIAGGMGRLAQAMADLARMRGAEIVYGTRVRRIARQNGRVSGVVTDDGNTLPATHVIFNGDPAALRAGALGPASTDAVGAGMVTPRSLSAQVWAFAATPQGPDLVHHNVFFTADPEAEFGPLARGEIPGEATLYVCAQDRGLPPRPAPDAVGRDPRAPERFEIIRNAPPGLPPTPEEYDRCHQRTFSALARFGLRFSPEPGPAALSGPATFERLFPHSDGALYGRSPHGLMAPMHRPLASSALPGLYLAGGGVHPGPGVPMAALSGRHAAEAILTALGSTSTSRRMATAGGMSMASPMTGRAPSR